MARYLLKGFLRGALKYKKYMPNNSIYLESGLWRREQSHEIDPLRVFPKLFNVNATRRSIAAESSQLAPEFEVAEARGAFLLSARVPGITAAQLQVRVTAQLVIVSRNEGPATVSATAGERTVSLTHTTFRKAFVLPAAVDARRLKVAIEGDLLTIKLPKRTLVPAQRALQKTR